MSDAFVFPGDVIVRGGLYAQSITAPTGSVNNASVAAAAGIAASKLQHDLRKTYAQESATNATAESRVIHVAIGAGTVNAFSAGSVVVAIGAATATVDLLKNGTTVLSAAITLDSSNTVRVAESGSVTDAAYVAGDVFEVVITATAGGGTLGKGVFAQAQFFEVSQ